EPAAASRARPVNNAALERLSSITERVQARPAAAALEQAPAKKEAYRWKATTVVEETKVEVATPKALKKALEHEKTPELAAKLAEEAVERDSWAAEVSQLAVPKLVEQVALNAWKEQEGSRVCLHLRPSQRHLNSASAQQKLAEALGVLYGTPVELTIVEDDNPAMRTPLEWRQAIYEEKLAQAREAIIADNNIQTLRRFFDADLDEESIRPI
ncbi:TPA: DNA polymerase III subunit gamma/tau C-terminal domain-containing protein, partial [Klebsiella pneumoniae]|nr:DNA polymerase III subunit gamma/tau [Klebsiella pneumoniae]